MQSCAGAAAAGAGLICERERERLHIAPALLPWHLAHADTKLTMASGIPRFCQIIVSPGREASNTCTLTVASCQWHHSFAVCAVSSWHNMTLGA